MIDLRSYVNGVKERKAGRIRPVPEFKTYDSFLYSGTGLRSPFEPETVEEFNEEPDTETASISSLAPDFNRNREALESFPLDALRFVGSLEKENSLWAIIISPDGLVHKVRVNNYMGQNFGKIIQVSESSIELVELIKDIRQGWVERETVISLIEN